MWLLKTLYLLRPDGTAERRCDELAGTVIAE
jgi:hypothetical protein